MRETANPLPSRRKFISSTAAVAAAAAVVLPGCATRSPSVPATKPATAPATTTAPASQPVKLKVGIVGVGGRGADHVREIAAIPEAEVVALCDVDVNHLVNAARTIPKAAVFVDFRELMKLPGLEAVVVSTPDHTHAVISAAALRAGKHVYCEKPLAHTVREARAITQLAAETKRVTQLGIQIHAMDNYRRVVEIIQAGMIGPVTQVEIWNNRTNRAPNPAEAPVPSTLNYDLWLGPVSQRPFRPDYHPFNWRRWWAFGSGMLGDIGCHLMDVAFWALDLKYPTRVECHGEPPSADTTPETYVAAYDFPARGNQPALKMNWYDLPKVPPDRDKWGLDPKLTEGVMFIGEKGMLFTDYGQHMLLPEEKFKTVPRPTTRIAKSVGHQLEWVRACLANDPAATSVPFSYGGPLSEAALLGVVAFRAQRPLEWDSSQMRFPSVPEADKLLGYDYRSGWTL